jgi:opacity protein-like surface antigen
MFFNKVLMTKAVIFSAVLAIMTCTVSTDANAKYTKRADKWEASFKLLNNQSSDVDGQGGSGLAIDSDYGWGFTLGYNVNPHILLNYEFSSSTPSYKAIEIDNTGGSQQVNGKMDLLESQFNVVYSLFASQFTPYVQAGVGWSYIDSNIVSDVSQGCWWTWWGEYYCDTFVNTYDDTRFSYNVAVGFRYELDNSLFLRASYKQSVIDFSHSDDASIGSYHIEVGSIF